MIYLCIYISNFTYVSQNDVYIYMYVMHSMVSIHASSLHMSCASSQELKPKAIKKSLRLQLRREGARSSGRNGGCIGNIMRKCMGNVWETTGTYLGKSWENYEVTDVDGHSRKRLSGGTCHGYKAVF